MAIAGVGLGVNLLCAWWLHEGGHAHDHGHHHDHDHHDHHEHHADHHHHDHADAGEIDPAHAHPDLNLRSAYLHVLSDAATSVLAIAALAGGLLWGWRWLDPAMGLVGSVLVVLWARGLVRDTARVLLDIEDPEAMPAEVRRVLAGSGLAVEVADLHVWRVGRGRYACVLGIETADASVTPARVRDALAPLPALAHVTIELAKKGASPD
jgi:cation diffusion facilitator family transporter